MLKIRRCQQNMDGRRRRKLAHSMLLLSSPSPPSARALPPPQPSLLVLLLLLLLLGLSTGPCLGFSTGLDAVGSSASSVRQDRQCNGYGYCSRRSQLAVSCWTLGAVGAGGGAGGEYCSYCCGSITDQTW